MLLTDALPLLIERKKPFVVYRLPKADKPVTLTDGIFRQKMHENRSKSFFVIAPFDQTGKLSANYFYPQKMQEGWELGFINVHTDTGHNEPMPDLPVSINKKDYLASARSLIQNMKAGEVKKVVLSRVIEKKLPDSFHIGKAFEHLCQEHPNAFVYVFLNEGQLWMGATPETLLDVTANQAKTMALAGTQKIQTICPTKYSWDDKETEEHEIVRDFIFQILHQLKLDHLRQHPPTSVVAGKMVHLRTLFEFEIAAAQHPIAIAQALHPTPAICGFPKEEALALIKKEEAHERSYYAGFLGPSSGQQTALFVNLRCMQLIGDKAYIYVGGGLTAASDPESEWDETALKAGTMLSVIQNNS